MKSTLFLSVLLLVGVLAYTSSACNNCTGSTPICSTDGVTCVGCSANSQCWAISSNMETCDTLTGACGACNSSASCSDALPICGAAGFCTACNASAECNEHLAGSVCDFGTGTCGWCFNSTDCLGYGTGYTCENVTTTIRRCTAPAFTIPGAPDPNNLAGVITAYVIICIVLLMLFIMFIVCGMFSQSFLLACPSLLISRLEHLKSFRSCHRVIPYFAHICMIPDH